MSRRTTPLMKAALSALHYTGADGLLAPYTKGAGAIIMLHQVCPEPPAQFAPNRILKVTPAFLEETIQYVLEAGFDALSLDEVARRVNGEDTSTRPFVCFTLDDAYRDNLVMAYPVFKRYGTPFAVYLPTDYADGKGELWWLLLERSLAVLPATTVTVAGVTRTFRLGTTTEKYSAFHHIYWALRALPDELDARRIVRELALTASIDSDALCRELIMTWDEVRALAADPLVTIGAHTQRHCALAKLTTDDARFEMAESVKRIEAELGRPCRHFSYPFGDKTSAGMREFKLARELGLVTAVTTRKGTIPSTETDLFSLPRVSLNGDYQSRHFVKVLLTGAPFSVLNFAQRMLPARA